MPKQSERQPKCQPTSTTQAIQLKVTLACIEPPIWRRIVLPDNFTLGHLHDAIQATFGWEEHHMHQFWFGKGRDRVLFTKTKAFEIDDAEDEDITLLSQVITRRRQVFRYEYDFGDDWVHEVLVEDFIPFEPKAHYPLCLDGARNGPPEDCGGAYGYCGIVEELEAHGLTREGEPTIEWLGKYDPETFDLEAVNKRLSKWRKWRK
jgi:hypothetical protein